VATALHSPDSAYACPACGDAVAEIGAVCPGCGSSLGIERCVVEVWRGYTTATFIARTADELVAESPSFRCRGRHAPADNPTSQSALSALTSALLASGWSAAPDDGGPDWFELAFGRLVATPPADELPELDEEPAEPVAPPARPELVRTPPPPLPVLEEAAPKPVPAPRPEVVQPTHARGSRVVTVVSIAGIVVASILGYVIANRSPTHTTRVVTVTRTVQPTPSAQATARKHAAVPAVVAAPVVQAVRVHITATRDTWLELRRNSKAGPVVFSGILTSGQSLRTSGRRVWARFAAAGNVDVAVNGKRVDLVGTLERLFAAPRR
jgi:hypothetical protein